MEKVCLATTCAENLFLFSSFFALNAGRKSLPCNNLLLLALKTYKLRPTFFPFAHQATDEEDGVGDHKATDEDDGVGDHGGSDEHDN